MSTDPCCPCCGTTERRPEGGIALDQPGELGYQCPTCGKGNDLDDPASVESLTWSEWAAHLWCHACEKDIPTAQCPIRRPAWMSDEAWTRFIGRLPFTAIVVESAHATRRA